MTTFKIDLDMSKALAEVRKATEKGVRAGVEFILTEANQHVPHDEGTLERTGRATTDGLKGAVSYDTPYAVRQHEDMSLHHDGKGESKWLENTMTREKNRVAAVIATASQVG